MLCPPQDPYSLSRQLSGLFRWNWVCGVSVLHVPDLRSNLLSCLYLARHKGFNITVNSFLTFNHHLPIWDFGVDLPSRVNTLLLSYLLGSRL
jgi:hypothetical protein